MKNKIILKLFISRFRNMRLFSTLFFIFLGSITLNAQIGGKTTFAALDIITNARNLGLGGNFISIKDEDPTMGISNPSLLNAKMHKRIAISQALHPGKTAVSSIVYAHKLKKDFTLGANFRYISIGKIDKTDEAGNVIGDMSPNDLILGIGLSKQVNKMLSIGGNFNFINSSYHGYIANGISLDFGGTIFNEDKGLLFTAMVKNIGFVTNRFVKGGEYKETLPANIQMAISHKLKHAPFRISVLAHHLNTWNLAYTDPSLKPTIDALTGDTIPVKREKFFGTFFRHLTPQLEVLIGKNMQIRLAFDYNRRKNFALDTKGGLAGFSAGIGYKFKRISIDYGILVYSQAGTNNMLTVSLNMDQMRKKATKTETTPIELPPAELPEPVKE